MKRLWEFATSEFPCHQTAIDGEDEDGNSEFQIGPKTKHCAGMLIFLEKRDKPNQMMRICERIGMYDRRKLDMTAEVR